MGKSSIDLAARYASLGKEVTIVYKEVGPFFLSPTIVESALLTDLSTSSRSISGQELRRSKSARR